MPGRRPPWGSMMPVKAHSTDCQWRQDTPVQICVPTNTADRSVSRLSMVVILITLAAITLTYIYISTFLSFSVSFLSTLPSFYIFYLYFIYLFSQFLNFRKTHFHSEVVLFKIKNEISCLNSLLVLVYPPFHLFESYIYIYTYIYIYWFNFW